MNAPGDAAALRSGLLFALTVTAAAGVAALSLELVLPTPAAMHIVTGAVAFACVLRTLQRADGRAGRIAAFAVWAGSTLIVSLLQPAIGTFALLELGLVWLIRAACLYETPTGTAVDFAFIAGGAALAGWAALHTASPLLTVWCVLLSLAVADTMPTASTSAPYRRDPGGPPSAREFGDSLRAAEDALRRLAAQRG